MKINEKKKNWEYKRQKDKVQNNAEKIYSNHNAIMINIDFISKMEAKGEKKIITK